MAQIDSIGEKIFCIMLVVGYWVALLSGVGQIINEIAKRNVLSALKLALSYAVAFGSIYAIKWLLDMIRETFS